MNKDLFDVSAQYKNQADEILEETGLAQSLEKYGQVLFTGSYAGDVMMSGDIDAEVVRDEAFSDKETLEVFEDLYFQNTFRSYFLKGNWDDPRLGNEFPDGRYIGLRYKLGDEKWKIDIWLVSVEESKKRDANINISKVDLTPEQKKAILEIKKYREDNNLPISGQEIYNAVLNEGVMNVEEFKKR